MTVHNFSVCKHLDNAPEDWLDNNDHSKTGDPDGLPSDDDFNEPVPNGAKSDWRRTQLMHHMEETRCDTLLHWSSFITDLPKQPRHLRKE